MGTMQRDLGRREAFIPAWINGKLMGIPGGILPACTPLAGLQQQDTAEALQTQHSGVLPADSGRGGPKQGFIVLLYFTTGNIYFKPRKQLQIREKPTRDSVLIHVFLVFHWDVLAMEGIGKEGCNPPLPSTRVHSIVKQCLSMILYFLYI